MSDLGTAPLQKNDEELLRRAFGIDGRPLTTGEQEAGIRLLDRGWAGCAYQVTAQSIQKDGYEVPAGGYIVWSAGRQRDGAQALTFGNDWLGQERGVAGAFEKPEPRIERVGKLIEEERVYMWFSQPGAHKSNVAMACGIATAAGVPWAGNLNTVQSPVIYISQDMGDRDMRERLHAFLNGYRIQSEVPFYYFTFPQPPLELVNNTGPLRRAIKTLGARLVFIDNLFNCAGVRDENSSEMGLALKALSELRDTTGVSIVTLHHPAKGTERSRGHSSILANVDESVVFKRTDNLVSFEAEKERNAPLAKLVVRFRYEHYPGTRLMSWANFQLAEAGDIVQASSAELIPLVLAFAAENPGSNKGAFEEAIAADGQTIRKLLDRLVETRELIRTKGPRNAQLHWIPGAEPKQEEIPLI